MDYPLTKKQQATIDKAIELLAPYNTECASSWTGYFEEQDEDGDRIGDHDFGDYDTCDNDECLNHNHAILKGLHPGLNIEYRWDSNDGDHDRYDLCSVCGRHLNNSLTWINDEIDNHIEYSTTKETVTDPSIALEISGCLTSMRWNADERMSAYCKANNYEQGIKRQKYFIKKVVNYSKHIIKILS